MFNDLLSRFSKARKIKWPSFFQTISGSTLLKRKKHHMVCTQWVKIRIFVTHRIKEILSFIKVKSAVKCCSSSISFMEQYWHNLRCSIILGVHYLPYSIINLWLLVLNFASEVFLQGPVPIYQDSVCHTHPIPLRYTII